MYCANCGQKRQHQQDRFCSGCDFPGPSMTESMTGQESSKDFPGPSTTESMTGQESSKEKPLTFSQFSKAKSKSWFRKVKGKESTKKTVEVVIHIGIISWHEKSSSVKPIRGKRVCLRIKSDATYEDIRVAGLKRMRDFHSEVIEEDLDYLLTFESGEIAYFIPGTTEDFILSKFKQELGKEYKQITLYLVSESDRMILEKNRKNPFENDDDDDLFTSSLIDEEPERNCKKLKTDNTCKQQTDEEFAENLQLYFDHELLQPMPDMATPLSEITEPLFEPTLPPVEFQQPKGIVSISLILEELAKNVKLNEQFFLNVRRNSDIQRILSLWGRQKKQSPEMKLMVKFIGESGIDSGALSKEFLADVLQKIGATMFPGDAPKESMSDVQNGNFLYCGQIIAVSLVQGGPPPNFLHKNVYDLLCNDKLDIKALDIDKHFVRIDKILFNQIRNDPVGCSTIIFDNGYNGLVSNENIEQILETMMISIISRRQTYMGEVINGLKLFGLHQKIVENKDVMENLFVRTENLQVDSSYVLSLLEPIFSSDASSKRVLEEKYIDYLQDFINDLEDSNIAKICTEPMACYENDEVSDDTLPYGDIETDLSVSGLLGWLTGQKHRPLFGEDLHITVTFNHECYVMYPEHKICFPVVSACARELTLPTQHFKTYEGFKENLLMAFSNGQAFGRS